MCGRYTLTADPEELAVWFDLPGPPSVRPRYNVAPSQLVAVVGRKPGGPRRGLAVMSWGFVPRWASSPTAGPRPINAKAETVATKAPFRDAFRQRRCLLPTTGFYEWAKDGRAKRAVHFRPRVPPVAFAGVWDVWSGSDGPPLYTCAVITVPANELVRPYHDRMPAILGPGAFDRWLDPATPPAEALGLLAPFPAAELEAVPVGPAVNSPRNDGPECLDPAA